MRPTPGLVILALLSAGARLPAQLGTGCRYLIIAADEYVSVVQPLAEWKTSKGMSARVVPLSVTGTTPTQVQNYVRNAWANWPTRPENLLLCCAPRHLPGNNNDDDCYYGNMQGDYRMEIAVGRLPAENVSECRAMVAKILAYERTPPVTDTIWYRQGTTIVAEDDSLNPDPYYFTDSRHAHQLWRTAGYTRIDSFGPSGSTTRVVTALNDGRAYITYRGVAGGVWSMPYYTFFPDATWQNRGRMPIVISATCETITLAPSEVMLGNACLRYGSEAGLGGMVAFFGTSMSGYELSQYRSAVYRGFFDAVFSEGAGSLGAATLRARFRVDSLYHRRDRYVEWCLLGDPDLALWTRPPRTITVTHDSLYRLGGPLFPVAVLTEGQPVAGAIVCCWMDTAVYVIDTTDSSGRAELDISSNRPGLMQVTVTGPNLRPYSGSCRLEIQGGPFCAYHRYVISDPAPGGNGDSCISPGETFDLPVWVRNWGDSAAGSVTATLSTLDTLALVLDSTCLLGTVLPDDSLLTPGTGFRCRVGPTCPEGRNLLMNLRCASGPHVWDSRFRVPVGLPALELTDTSIVELEGNGNQRFDPNEAAALRVTLYNSGQGTALNLRATLRSLDPRLSVEDSLALLPDAGPGTATSNSSNPFVVRAGNMVPQTEIPCSLIVSAPGRQWRFGFGIVVGITTNRDPVPDGPRVPALYWAFDDTDTAYAEHPDFSWVELRGSGTRLTLGDNTTVTLDLPETFGPFYYYGQRYTRLSVCANGWVAPGTTTFTGYASRRLPAQVGTPLIAVNWDDLYPPYGGGVLYALDSAGHRLIVEWDSVHYRARSTQFDKFQFILYDSTLAAADGNNEFMFQYRYNRSMTTSTVGLQDSTNTIGMTLLYRNSYHAAAAPIYSGRAIKFTTDVPIPGFAEERVLPDNRRVAFQVSPNPARGSVVLFCNVQSAFCNLNSSSALLSIFDAAGRLVLHSSFDLRTSSFALDLCSLAPGVYFVSLTSAGTAATQKLVIQD